MYGVQQPQSPERVHISGVLRGLKRNPNVALRPKIINLLWLHSLNHTRQAVRIRQVAVVQTKTNIRIMWVLVEVVDPRSIERRSTPLYAVHLISLFEQELRQVRSILPGDAGDQRFFHR